MTGFGAAEGEVGSGRVSVEVRSVNHRFFSPSIKLPGVLARWEGDVREAMRRGVSRGHVTLFARFERDVESNGALPLDEARFAAYVTQLRALEAKYELGQSLDLATMLRLPDLMVSNAREELTAEALPQVIAVVDKAVEALLQMRAAEGTRLVAFLVEPNAHHPVSSSSATACGPRCASCRRAYPSTSPVSPRKSRSSPTGWT